MTEVELAPGTSAVALDAGDVLVVRMPENATTGYLWHVVPAEGLTVVDDQMGSGATAPGSAGTRTLRVRAELAGAWRLELRLRRPWEDEVRDERRVDVTVR